MFWTSAVVTPKWEQPKEEEEEEEEEEDIVQRKKTSITNKLSRTSWKALLRSPFFGFIVKSKNNAVRNTNDYICVYIYICIYWSISFDIVIGITIVPLCDYCSKRWQHGTNQHFTHQFSFLQGIPRFLAMLKNFMHILNNCKFGNFDILCPR